MKYRYVLLLLAMTVLTGSYAYSVDIKDVTLKIPNFGKVVFNHNQHFRQEGIKSNCKTCHNAIFNLRSKARFSMADMEKGKSCGACHNGQRAFGLRDCIRCHKVANVTMKVKETGPVIFRHKTHLGAYKCDLCHPKVFDMAVKKPVTMAQMEKGKSCGVCHNGKDSFSVSECVKCHPVREVAFQVKDTGDVKFSHELHTAMYKCGDCHVKLYLPTAKNKRKTMAQMEQAQSCGACHDDKTAFTVKENCDRCHQM